jgi:hypothetical protein
MAAQFLIPEMMLWVNNIVYLELSETASVILLKGIWDACRTCLVANIGMCIGAGYRPLSALGRAGKSAAARLICMSLPRSSLTMWVARCAPRNRSKPATSACGSSEHLRALNDPRALLVASAWEPIIRALVGLDQIEA